MNILQRLISKLRVFRSSLAPAFAPSAAAASSPGPSSAAAAAVPPFGSTPQGGAAATAPQGGAATQAGVPPHSSLVVSSTRWLSALLRAPVLLTAPLIAAILVLMVLSWMGHDAALRQQFELRQIRRQADAQIAAVSNQSNALVHQAADRAASVQQELSTQRRRLQQASATLDARLAASRLAEQLSLSRIATAPARVIAASVASQLESSSSPAPLSGPSLSTLAATAPGVGFSSSPTPGVSFSFSEAKVRGMAVSLAELSACRTQSSLQDLRFSNLRSQLAASDSAVAGLQHSVNDLQSAVALKDVVITRKDAGHQAELRAVRGTRTARLLRAAQFIAVGFVAGMVAR